MTDKKRITLDIPKDLYKELHEVIVAKYGVVYGHIREAFIEGTKMWIAIKKSEISEEELCQIQ